jgi:hypothetical protein
MLEVMTNTRREKRFKKRIRMEASVPVRVGDQQSSTQALTRDISTQGVYIYMETRVTHGSMIEMVLPLPPASEDQAPNWVHCKCRVLRVEDISSSTPEYGVAAAIEEFQTVPQAQIPEE